MIISVKLYPPNFTVIETFPCINIVCDKYLKYESVYYYAVVKLGPECLATRVPQCVPLLDKRILTVSNVCLVIFNKIFRAIHFVRISKKTSVPSVLFCPCLLSLALSLSSCGHNEVHQSFNYMSDV